MDRDNPIKTAHGDNPADWIRECTDSKFLARLVKPLGKYQNDAQTRAADEGHLLKVQDQGIVSGIDSSFQGFLEFTGVATVYTTGERRDQDPISPLPLDDDSHFEPLLRVVV